MIRKISENIPCGSILGINYSGAHDSSIAIVAPSGECLFACSLERVSREKQDGRPPSFMLDGIKWENIAHVAVSTDERPWSPPSKQSKLHPARLLPPRFKLLAHEPQFLEYIKSLPGEKKFVCHQMSHAASAFWPSGFDEALVLTYDGGMHNSPWFGGLYKASRHDGLKPLDMFAASDYAKITTLYTAVTAILGFTPNKHEGKITGLAAYGAVNSRCLAELSRLFTDDYFLMEEVVEWHNMYSADKLPTLIVNEEKRRILAERFNGISREDMAATVQAMAEKHVLAILENAKKQGWMSDSICLGGGLFANVKINQRVKERGFKNIFVAPAMTDDGTALGAALHTASSLASFAPKKIRNVFLGFQYDDEAVKATLGKRKIIFEKVADPASFIAGKLSEGAVVAVFQGRMEFGPRALGHRSILSQATEHDINKTLNDKLARTEFMPFAPVTRYEDADGCYLAGEGSWHAAEFMTATFTCTEELKKKCPAIVHLDGTARPQLVRREENPLIYDILTIYKEKTGAPALVNTSFNVHEEPIVNSPDDAIDGFLESGLDYLYLEGGYVAEFARNEKPALAHLQELRNLKGKKLSILQDINAEIWRRNHILKQEVEAKENLIKLQNAQIVMQKEELEEKENIIKTQSYQTADISLLQTILMNRTIQRYFYPRLGAFYQHPPKNIEIPESYYSPRPLASPPLISIVTPSFKHGAFIERTIKSVIDQKYPNLEYIVQDGGSTDETTDILKKYGANISHWESAKDKGQSNAINLGFQHAHGEIMAYLNSDDLLLPGTLNYVAAYFSEHPDVDVVYGHRVIVQGDDLEIGRWVLPRHRDYALNWADYLPQETMFWRKSLWEKSEGYIDEQYNFAMDWELICRFRKAGAKIVRLPRFLGAFRVHSAQKTTSQMAKVGAEEMRRIRHMIHKRPVTNREIAWKLKPYMLEHIILQKLYRFGLLKY